MFTGIVERLGHVAAIRPEGSGLRLRVRADFERSDVRLGDSVATDGICLTVTALFSDGFEATAGSETLAHTTLPSWRPGRRVHLERALRLSDRLGGHLVQGHVDGVARVLSVVHQDESHILWCRVPEELLRYVAIKGSVALDGVSLTVNELRGPDLRVNLIPHTWSSTHFAELRSTDGLNIETDIIARYLERLSGHGVGPDGSGGLSLQRLRENGYL